MKRTFIILAFLCSFSIVNTIFANEKVDISSTVASTDDDDPDLKGLLDCAIAGDAKCQYYLGRCFYGGEIIKQNYNKAFKWFLSAANQGHVESTYYVGRCLIFGQGTEKNILKGIEFLKNAASHGCEEAQHALDVMTDEVLKMENAAQTQSSASTAKSQDQTKGSSSTQAQPSVKRNNSGIITLKNHVFGFVSTPPSQCTISTVINEVQSKYGFKPSVTLGTLLTWYEITKPVGFDFVLNGKRLGSASFYQGNNYRLWEYQILELKTSTTFNASVNYVKQLQSELEAEGYVFEIKSSGNENYNVESRNKDVIIELDCCSASKFAAHDAWNVNINFRTK